MKKEDFNQLINSSGEKFRIVPEEILDSLIGKAKVPDEFVLKVLAEENVIEARESQFLSTSYERVKDSDAKESNSQLLKRLREENGLTVRELAARTELHFTTVSRIENGRSPGSAAVLRKLFSVLMPREKESK
ncbi:MAG: helix-turn-helix domain-containing protein [Bdellovibrionota bacterium]